MNLKGMCKEFGINARGIVQVGAHRGQEMKEFLSLEPDRILLVEANPHLIIHLKAVYAKLYKILKIVHCAASNYDGTVRFNILSNDMSSSILPLKKHAEIYPQIIKNYDMEVPCRKLDTLIKENDEKLISYNILDMDVQGAEGLVFEGAKELLKYIDVIQVEVNYEELYEGCILEPELTDFLRKNGFEKKAVNPYHPTWADAFYVRIKEV